MKEVNRNFLTMLLFTLSLLTTVPAQATIISFFGGEYRHVNDENNSIVYREGDYQVDLINDGGEVWEIPIGDYYYADTHVLHVHWNTGFGDDITTFAAIKFSRIDGRSFDLNYFELISNTANAGGAARGNEQLYLFASEDGITPSFSMLVPPADWGYPSTGVLLGPEFRKIKSFWFIPGSDEACFGIDTVYLDQTPSVTTPASLLLTALALTLLGWLRRRPAPVTSH